MADLKISQLPAITSTQEADVVPIVDSGVTSKITVANLRSSLGSNSFVYNEVPSGTVDGSNAVFDTASTYVSGSIEVFRDGQLMKNGGADYTETDSNTITFTTAPVAGSVLIVNYQHSTGASGNADTLDGFHAAITPAASTVAVHDASGILKSPIYAPQGFLLNGKIVPSVSSNNLTVAIKGVDGNNPSASNPVYVRIGDTIRSITGALSVTKNAGTNWFNSGSASLATLEVDYFVYLGYNATDGVVIGFSRIPWAAIYSDFSSTTTNEKYAAISTITNAAAGDYYEVVGRFAATLSAGAGYTWTVPSFTGINLIQRPIHETRWSTFAAQVTWTAGTAPTNGTKSERYKITDKTLIVNLYNYSYTAGSTVTRAEVLSPMGTTNYSSMSAFLGVGITPNANQSQVDPVSDMTTLSFRIFCTSVSADKLQFFAICECG